MGKGIKFTYHGEWGPWCNRDIPEPGLEKGFLSFDLFDESSTEASLPALEVPHASRPCVRFIRDLAFPDSLLN